MIKPIFIFLLISGTMLEAFSLRNITFWKREDGDFLVYSRYISTNGWMKLKTYLHSYPEFGERPWLSITRVEIEDHNAVDDEGSFTIKHGKHYGDNLELSVYSEGEDFYLRIYSKYRGFCPKGR